MRARTGARGEGAGDLMSPKDATPAHPRTVRGKRDVRPLVYFYGQRPGARRGTRYDTAMRDYPSLATQNL